MALADAIAQSAVPGDAAVQSPAPGDAPPQSTPGGDANAESAVPGDQAGPGIPPPNPVTHTSSPVSNGEEGMHSAQTDASTAPEQEIQDMDTDPVEPSAQQPQQGTGGDHTGIEGKGNTGHQLGVEGKSNTGHQLDEEGRNAGHRDAGESGTGEQKPEDTQEPPEEDPSERVVKLIATNQAASFADYFK